MEDSTVWNGFIRQRRNLILISIVLLLVHAAGLKFTTINLLGNKAELPNQTVIHWVLWIGWFYWLVRYYQYCQAIENKGIKSEYELSLSRCSKYLAFKRVQTNEQMKELKKKTVDAAPSYRLKPNAFSPTSTQKHKKLWTHPVTGRLTVCIYDQKAAVDPLGTYYDDKETFEISFSQRDLLMIKTMGGLYVMFNTRLVTEYILPFIIGISPPIYILLKAVIH